MNARHWCLGIAGTCLGLLAPLAASAQEPLTVVTFGGAYENAASKAFFEPFSKETGTAIVKEQYSGGLAKLRAMVEAKNTTWDVLDLETNDAITACDEGLIQKLDPKVFGDKADFIAGATLPCSVASMIWSTVFAYDTTKLKTEPKALADFFDLQRFPGKRGVRKKPKVILEWALLADGVPKGDVYKVLGTPAGLDRAFKKLDTIKKEIVWWEAGAQAPQILADGAVVMTMAYNGRINAVQKSDKKPFKIVWDNQIYDYEWWGIPAGTRKADAAARFIAYASKPDVVGNLSRYIAYAPPRPSAAKTIPADVLQDLPTAPENFGSALQIDANFWADNNDAITNRFQTWLGQ